MVISLAMASCSSSTTTSSQTSTTATTATTSAAVTIPTTSNVVTTSSAATTSETTAVTTTSTGNWWDTLGTPQYGGTLNIQISTDPTNFDPYYNRVLETIQAGWMERLFADNWTVNPTAFDYQMQYRGNQWTTGQLAQSWEFTNPNTFVVQLRQDVYWQNIAPANGRQFVASDVAFHYGREYGVSGDGFTKQQENAWQASYLPMQDLISVTATDKFTVAFVFKTPNPENIMEILEGAGRSDQCIECPDAVQLWGDVSDWHHAIGTGPFMLTDFVDSESATLTKNPNYWGYDERYPQNKLPYVNGINILVIANNATALAALRAGKLDALDGQTFTAAQGMQVSNPNILRDPVPFAYGLSIDPRNDKAPFNNVNVREALQMAINLPEIASSYYEGTTSPDPVGLTSDYLTGWGFPYNQWPASLQAQYAFNPTQAKQLLAGAGFPNGFNTDVVVDSGFDIELLQIIQSEFAAIGVNLSINQMPYASWVSYVQTNHSNDALATRSTGGLMGNTYEPMIELDKFDSNDQANDWAMISDPNYDALYTQALAATSVAQVQQILMQTNQLIAQQHYVISLLQPTGYSFVQPWLKGGYVGQYGALSGTGGPSLLYFYGARLWIDQNLKSQ